MWDSCDIQIQSSNDPTTGKGGRVAFAYFLITPTIVASGPHPISSSPDA